MVMKAVQVKAVQALAPARDQDQDLTLQTRYVFPIVNRLDNLRVEFRSR
jgi:hypothetical protein